MSKSKGVDVLLTQGLVRRCTAASLQLPQLCILSLSGISGMSEACLNSLGFGTFHDSSTVAPPLQIKSWSISSAMRLLAFNPSEPYCLFHLNTIFQSWPDSLKSVCKGKNSFRIALRILQVKELITDYDA
jgi:hypothetical protein